SKYCRAEEDTPIHAEPRDPTRVITKKHARDLTRQLAYFLRNTYGIGESGLNKDVVVSITTGQSALSCLFFGVVAAGGIYAPASHASTASDLARQLKDGPGKLLVCSSEFVNVAEEAAELANLPWSSILVYTSHPQVSLASLDGSIACDFKGSLEWKRITNKTALEKSRICILYSSGTTGLPKGVLLSHMNLVSGVFLPAHANRPVYDRWGREGQPFVMRTIAHLPPAHIAGLEGYLINPFFHGGIVYWMQNYNFADFLRYSGELHQTYLFTVPPVYIAAAKNPAVKNQFALVRHCKSGAAPLSEELQDLAGKRFGCGKLSQAWGLSETSGTVTHVPADADFTMGSIGMLMHNGYHNNPEANANAFSKDGWFKTGDILEKRGSEFFVVDRKKELIKYKGLQVAPAELEGLIASSPLVLDAAVIGIPQNNTEVPLAYVVLAPTATGKVTEQDIAQMVKDKVANHKQLRGGVKIVDAIPRSASGKILRKELKQKY
ncbi:hypothetical protein Golomagni_06840, partial [Golovinomyces magnicellulatus]